MTDEIPSSNILYLEPSNWKTDNGNDKLPGVKAISRDVYLCLTSNIGLRGCGRSANARDGNGNAGLGGCDHLASSRGDNGIAGSVTEEGEDCQLGNIVKTLRSVLRNCLPLIVISYVLDPPSLPRRSMERSSAYMSILFKSHAPIS